MAPLPYCLSIWVTAKSTALPLLESTFVSAFVSPFVIESPSPASPVQIRNPNIETVLS
jgi:hypothetical protein